MLNNQHYKDEEEIKINNKCKNQTTTSTSLDEGKENPCRPTQTESQTSKKNLLVEHQHHNQTTSSTSCDEEEENL